MTAKRPTMTEEQARAVLREYPDADLRAFDILNAFGRRLSADDLAVEETERTLSALATRWEP